MTRKSTMNEAGQQCSGCGDVLPWTAEYFHHLKHRDTEFAHRCKPCRRAYQVVRNLQSRLGHVPTYGDLLSLWRRREHTTDLDLTHALMRVQEVQRIPATVTIVQAGQSRQYLLRGAA